MPHRFNEINYKKYGVFDMNIDVMTNGINALNLEISHSAHVFLDERWRYTGIHDPVTRLYFVRSGRGFLQYGGTRVEMTGGNVYIVPSELEFSCGCESLEKLYFHILMLGVEKFDLLKSVKGIYSLPFSEEDFSMLMSLYCSDNYLDLLEVKLILCKTVVDFARKYNFEKIPVMRYSETVRRTMQYVQENLRVNLTLEEISTALFVSGSKIRKDFKKETGLTVGRYIDDLVFFEAKKLMETKNISIKDVSERLGFCDMFYFSRRFKERYKKTPSQYRREIRAI